MLATFVIGLREGLEAALIVGIVAAFLRQRGRSDVLRLVWLGVGVAIAICLAIAIALQLWSGSLPQAQQEALETVVGAVAVGIVTYMIVWMRRHARGLKRDLESAASGALAQGTAWALVAMAFFAVMREGLETAVFLLAAFNASGSALAAGSGAALGVAAASAIGYGIYRGGVKLDLARFFRLTGIVLVLVAAGLVATALHTAHEAGWIDLGQAQVFDLSVIAAPGSIQAALLTGALGIQPRPTVIETAGYLLYLIPMALYVAWPRRAGAARFAAKIGLVVLLAACGATSGGPASSAGASPAGSPGVAGAVTVVTITLTNAGCTPDRASIVAGPVTFKAFNDGGDRVSEVEVVRDGRILGEKENLAPGLSGMFALELAAGDHIIACPGAAVPETTLHVTAGATPGTASPIDAKLAAATTAYAAYVVDQVAQLVTSTKAFTDAVIAGDILRAKALYGPGRVFYERIEPVAESFGDLDPEIDERIDDAPLPADFTGFHRLEQALWEKGDLTGMAPIATKLQADVVRLQGLVATETYRATALANGAAELLDEIAASKVTGEEERYSHLDLLDFQANLDGARQAFELLEPALKDVDAALAASISGRFADVQKALDVHRAGDGFVLFSDVTAAQVKALAQAVDALAEPLSQVAAKLVAS